MNFDQARELSFLVKWKTAECFSGPECWCRKIVPIEPILYTYNELSDYEEEYEIVGDASIDKETAEYIVELHNERHAKHFDRVIQNCRDAMKETMDSLIPLAHQSVTLTNNPSIDDFRTIKRKEID